MQKEVLSRRATSRLKGHTELLDAAGWPIGDGPSPGETDVSQTLPCELGRTGAEEPG